MVLSNGTQIDNYKILKHLGSGGMGDVYLAEHVHMRMRYAFKVLQEEYALHPGFQERFVTEAQVMARLRHSNIVQVHNMGIGDEQTYYLVMDYVESPNNSVESLEDHLKENGGRLDIINAAKLAREICEALIYAHENGVLHRDLKTGNILYDKNQSYVLSDFGLAQIVGKDEWLKSISQSMSLGLQQSHAETSQGILDSLGGQESQAGEQKANALVGTFQYMAPEVKKRTEATEQSDLFSLAIILYQSLTGKWPEGRFRLPTQIDASIPKAWDDALDRALQHDPDDRQESIQEFLDDLRSVVGGKGTSRFTFGQGGQASGDEGILWNMNETWAFAEQYQGTPNDEEIKDFIGELTDMGVVGGGKLTRAQADKALREICQKWLEEEEKKRERTAWEKVREGDNPNSPMESKKSYENFINTFPQGAHIDQAKKRLDEINKFLKDDEEAWEKAAKSNSKSAIQSYQQTYLVGGQYLDEAKEMITRLEKEEADQRQEDELWSEAQKNDDIESYQTYLDQAPLLINKKDAKSRFDKLLWEKKNADLLNEWNHIKAKPGIEKIESFLEKCNDLNLLTKTKKLAWEIYDNNNFFIKYFAFGETLHWLELYEKLNKKIFKLKYPNAVFIPGLAEDSKILELVKIPAGTFMMGSPDYENERKSDECPQHCVTLTKGFYMSKYPVTQAQYKTLMSRNPFRFVEKNKPVKNITWHDAVRFCNRLSEIEGLQPVYIQRNDCWEINMEANGYRLPTEAEWEYACRAGTQTRFFWGNDSNYTKINEYAWYKANSNGKMHDVGLKKPNAWGLYDMCGNVWEWCNDWYGDYPNNDQVDPLGKDSGSGRVLRGGSWYYYARNCRSAYRDWGYPYITVNGLGFRISRTQ